MIGGGGSGKTNRLRRRMRLCPGGCPGGSRSDPAQGEGPVRQRHEGHLRHHGSRLLQDYSFGTRWFGDFKNAIPGGTHSYCIDLRYWYPGPSYGTGRTRREPDETRAASRSVPEPAAHRLCDLGLRAQRRPGPGGRRHALRPRADRRRAAGRGRPLGARLQGPTLYDQIAQGRGEVPRALQGRRERAGGAQGRQRRDRDRPRARRRRRRCSEPPGHRLHAGATACPSPRRPTTPVWPR